MKKQREHVMDLLFSLSLLCVFAACGLAVVFIGIQVYQGTEENMSDAFAARTAMAYVAKKVRQNDVSDAISLTEIEGVDALMITQQAGEDTYCTYIYSYNGYLCELYAKGSFSPTLAAGQSLIAVDEFDAAWGEYGTLCITITQSNGESSSLMLALQSDDMA